MDAVSAEARPNAADAKAHIRARGERVRKRERDRALARLRSRRDLSDHEAAVVDELAERLTDALLAVPAERLDAVDSGESDPAATVALELFGED